MPSLPRHTVMLRVDFSGRKPRTRAPGPPTDSAGDPRYAQLRHDDTHILLDIEDLDTVEMTPAGARVLSEALEAMADLVERQK